MVETDTLYYLIHKKCLNLLLVAASVLTIQGLNVVYFI